MEFNIELVEYKSNNKKQKNKRLIIAIICFFLAAAGIVLSSIGVPYCNMLDNRIVRNDAYSICDCKVPINSLNEHRESLTEKFNIYNETQYKVHQSIAADEYYDLTQDFIDLDNATYELNKQITSYGVPNEFPDYIERNDFLKKAYEIKKNNYYNYTNTGNKTYYYQIEPEITKLTLEYDGITYEPEIINFSIDDIISDYEYLLNDYTNEIERDQKLLDKYSVYVNLGYIVSYLLTIIGLIILLHNKKHNNTTN